MRGGSQVIRRSSAGAVFGLSVMLAACAGSDQAKQLAGTLAAPRLASSAPLPEGGDAGSKRDGSVARARTNPLGSSPSAKGSPTTVYERVARGALGCWFGARGPLTKTHIFTADAQPPSQGGRAEITIHERDDRPMPKQTPVGARVFRLVFERESDTTTLIQMEAAKLPQDLAEAMEADAVAWAAEKDQCAAQTVRPPPPAGEPSIPAKPRKRPPRRA